MSKYQFTESDSYLAGTDIPRDTLQKPLCRHARAGGHPVECRFSDAFKILDPRFRGDDGLLQSFPRNRLGVEDPDLLHEIEETLLQQAYQTFIAECEPTTRFDNAYFKSLHRFTLCRP